MVCRGCIRYGHGIFCYNHQTGYIFGILCVQLHLEFQGKRCILCPIVCGIWLCASFYPPWFCYYTFHKSCCDITSFSSSIIRSRNASNTSSSILNGSMPYLWHIFPFGTCSSIIFVCGICQNIAYTNCPNRQSLSIDQTVMSLSMIRCIRSGSRIQHGLLTKINTFRKLLENGSPTAQASNWFEIRITWCYQDIW